MSLSPSVALNSPERFPIDKTFNDSGGEELGFFLSEDAVSANLEFNPPRIGDAGFDLPALENTEISPGSFSAVRTGIHLAIPLGYVGLVRDRSSVALKGGACTAGVIDASYRGEVKVVIHNLGKEPLRFSSGDRIAQIVLLPHYTGRDEAGEIRVRRAGSVDELGKTSRAGGGFGSTGK